MRFAPRAIRDLRSAIQDAGGVEVFAIGRVDERGVVSELEIHCRGTPDAVPALLERPRAGQVVIHNHPSGDIRPSAADMALAGRYGDEGVGVVIVDNAVQHDNWVVEPARRKRVPIDRDRLIRLFEVEIPGALSHPEARPGQLQMALRVADTLDQGGVLVVEAGTGTGKSLAYLAPAVLWALANDQKVVVSTFTRTLQAQLVSQDIPVLKRAGVDFRHALVKGRNNYLCRRKLELALGEPAEDAEALERLRQWAASTEEGSRQEIEVEEELWDRVESDSDTTLRAACPHYNECFWYNARRRAAASQLVVVNHALLLTDLKIKAQTDGDGILPRFNRVILDEGHHLEDAATSAAGCELTALSVSRAVAPLLPRRRREGALARLRQKLPALDEKSLIAEDLALRLRDETGPALEHVGVELLGQEPQRRITAEVEAGEAWKQARPTLVELGELLKLVHDRLGTLQAALPEEIPSELQQPVLELGRAHRRLAEKMDVVRGFLGADAAEVRWMERGRREAPRLARAPVDVAPLIRELLAERNEAVVLTSATLSVAGRFDLLQERTGLNEADTAVFPSPFDYAAQALLVLPRDLPPPDAPGWIDAVSEAAGALIEASGGGAFVLCTSYGTVQEMATRLDARFGGRFPVLQQGRANRERLLQHFRDTDGAVLVGTDSFWEGVSVRGDALRLVIIPRLPFRVPTEPLSQARYERVQAQGRDPFRVFSLPEAVLKLRQGFGRLVRSKEDRGVVAILDRRVHEAWYGRIFLMALPPARRVMGPAQVVLPQVEAFYRKPGARE